MATYSENSTVRGLIHWGRDIFEIWKQPDVKEFISNEGDPVFRVKNISFEDSDNNITSTIEGVTYQYNYITNQYKFAMPNIYVVSNGDFSEIDIHAQSANRSSPNTINFEISRILQIVFSFRMLYLHGMLLHAAVAVKDDAGIAFCGVSGAGKSTQANLWKNTVNAWILNYDKPAVLLTEKGVIIHGTPWSGKERCFINKGVPLKAIVFVVQDSVNVVEQLSPADAYSLLLLNNYVYPINDTINLLYEQRIEEIIRQTPVYRLHCTKEPHAVEVLYQTLFGQKSTLGISGKDEAKLKIRKNFILRNIVDEYIVIPRGANALKFEATIVLNESGAYLWHLLEEETTIDEIVINMQQEYGISEAIARHDAEAFITLLRENNLLEGE